MSDSKAHKEAHFINASWLVKLRWSMVAGELVLLCAVYGWFRMPLPLKILLPLIALGGASNLLLWAWLRKEPDVREWMIGTVMFFDILLLTGLLYVTGGPANPFSFLYLVYIALGIVVLGQRWMWWICVGALLGYGSLFLQRSRGHHHAIHNPHHMQLHLEGMWVAYAITTIFIAYFVTRLKRALVRREEELRALHEQQIRSDKLASLAALAGGAVHEFATPLSTIAVVAKEMERQLEKEGGSPSLLEDTLLIREEVERCRKISQELMSQAGETLGEASASVSVEALFGSAMAELESSQQIEIRLGKEVGERCLPLPPQAFSLVLRSLLKNAQEASDPKDPIVLQGELDAKDLQIHVIDRGSGMSPETQARLGEPFFTTKPASEGHGLSLFLAKTLMEHLGGELRCQTAPGEGTTITLSFPLALAS